MQISRRNAFTTIRTDGGLLPADLLLRIAEGDRSIGGLTPESYHLTKSERLNEAATRAWNRLQGAWEGFRAGMDKLPESETGTTLTRERWLLILFQELGYGRLQTAKSIEIHGKTYPVSHIWQSVPIHLVSFRQEIDRRTPGARGAARVSPHSLVQELLIRGDDYLWGFVSNGLRLRLLRDNASLTRAACVEFDLQSMMEGQVYSDFFLLFLLCHQSRVEAPEGKTVEHCWLERWYNTSLKEGTRVLDHLRDGVEKAIEALGGGFLGHPANTALREKLRAGTLTTQDYYRQVLRVVYRLLFLFVAEDRDLLLRPAGEDARLAAARDLYTRHYSSQRLRRLAEKRRSARHADLYRALRLVFAKLHSGCPELALPALGSYLFAPTSTPDLNDADIANADLLAAVWNLTFTADGNVRRSVDYRNLGPEELGSVYESLLEMHPDVNLDAGRFTLTVAAGSERKTTGSYYTPTSLVNCLLDSALEPVIDERLADARRLANGQWRADGEKHYAYSIISGPGSLAARHESGGTDLPSDQDVPEGRGVRADQPNSSGSLVGPGQHRRGLGASGEKGVSAVSPYRSGQPSGTGDAPASGPASGPMHHEAGSPASSRGHHPEQATCGLESKPPAPERLEATWQRTPLATRYSLLAEQALLDLKVCDPACGSGHFLIAAAHRIAKRLATIRAGEDEPAPESIQRALRDVVGRCIYGVDINPMAVELCKINLWIEALEPGKPLSFLDHHIRCGNSLLGTTPALMKRGIPDDAFKPIEGDDKKVCSELKRQNRDDRRGQGLLPFGQPQWLKLGNLVQSFANLTDEDDSTPEALAAKEQHFAELVRSAPYENARLLADAWCAAFVCEKRPNSPLEITEAVFRRWEDNPHHIAPAEKDELLALRDQYNFFHWHLAFPEVFKPKPTDQIGDDELTGWAGGFDAILGNPPWERVKLQEKEWFATRRTEIANAPNAAARKRLIEALRRDDPALHQQFLDDLRKAEGESHLLRNSGRYPLCGRGDINVYAVFAEGMRSLLNERGRAGAVLPTGIATDDTTKFFFQDVVETQSLVSLFDFENKGVFFPGVHSSYKFCLFTAGRGLRPSAAAAEFVFFAHAVQDLRDPERRFSLSPEDIALLNPNTRTCPIFRSRRDAELTRAIYRRVPVLIREAQGDTPEQNPWGIRFSTMFHMSNDSHLFRTREQLEAEGWRLDGNVFRKDGEAYLPLYEAKMIHHFDHRWATYDGTDTRELSLAEKQDPHCVARGRYWVREADVQAALANTGWNRQWLLGWRDITNSTNERTVVSCVWPDEGAGDTFLQMFPSAPPELCAANAACLDSFAGDYSARQKIGGTHLKYHYFKQLPVLPSAAFAQRCAWSGGAQTLKNWLLPRVLELTYTAWDLEPFARDCGWDGPPFRWDEERRFLIRCELDAAFFHLYLPADANGDWRPARRADGCPHDETPEQLAELKQHFPTPRDAVAYIMETFPIVRRKDEEKYGSYRTKDTILEIYDEMQAAIAAASSEQRVASGEEALASATRHSPFATRYQTRLDPPPGPPCDVAGNFIPMAQWDPAHWPPHIHRPREEATISRPAAAAPAVIVPGDEIDLARLLEAFRQVRQGMSSDYVVADPQANRRFQEAARSLGLRADPARLNRALLNARKAGRLKDEPSASQYRLAKEYEPYVFASEWSVRHLQRQLLKEIDRMPALDELLADPTWAARFDEIAARIKPGFAPIDYRWAALAMRKKGRSRPLDTAVEMPPSRQLTLDGLFGDDLPVDPGLYLIRGGERPLYLNWAENLADQVQRHREVAGEQMVPPWLLDGVGRADQLRYTALRGLRERELQEMQITQVSRLQPWLNLLEVGDAA